MVYRMLVLFFVFAFSTFSVSTAAQRLTSEEINEKWGDFFNRNEAVTEIAYAGKLVIPGVLSRNETYW